MTDRTDLIYVIHGSNAHTWWRRVANRGYPWWRRWSLFNLEMRRTFEQECQIREFYWSGVNRHEARITAGAALARAIERAGPDRKIHLVGHSHGGNVALAAVNQLPPNSVASVVVLANPNIVVFDSRGRPPEWLYWGNTPERVQRIWNLYSPQDIVQCGLVRVFNGIRTARGKSLQVRPAYGGPGCEAILQAKVEWNDKLAAHRAMHSGSMGAVVGSLLRGETLESAMMSAKLSATAKNAVSDRGGWPGHGRTEQMIRTLGNPQPFDLGNVNAETGLLFIHGFTASPAELRPMAECLASNTNWRCKGPLLPGHGTRVEDMQGSRAEDWIDAVEKELDELSRTCRRVVLVGLSLGALLACQVALRRVADPKLRGLILMAPAFGVTPSRAVGTHLLRPFRNLRDKGKRASDYFLDNRLYTYLHIPLNRTVELMRVGQNTMRNMGNLKSLPTLMFVGERESTVSLRKMLAVAEENPWIRLVKLPASRHILPVEPDRELMFETSRRFVEEVLIGSQ